MELSTMPGWAGSSWYFLSIYGSQKIMENSVQKIYQIIGDKLIYTLVEANTQLVTYCTLVFGISF